ncbi:bacteriocin [Rhizobium sp. S152]|uniref:bacteriocin n=1 Tax=Rhizobium sp. S152 TaxID=3055038 RepID=UPI0025AA2280|nr:bacteriocin [Rhizobium sp. S152]MDM9624955.1 bacteriocin [Rhizobium sp. S152]
MNDTRRSRALLAMLLSASLLIAAGSAEAMDKKSRNIALGVGLGLLTGAVASQGDPRGAIGGAVAGGLIGAVVGRDHGATRREDWRRYDRDRRPHRYDRYQPRY